MIPGTIRVRKRSWSGRLGLGDHLTKLGESDDKDRRFEVSGDGAPGNATKSPMECGGNKCDEDDPRDRKELSEMKNLDKQRRRNGAG